MNQLQRTDSWPPTVLRLSTINESKDQENDITTLRLHKTTQDVSEENVDSLEENPFSYFLSSPEDSDDDEDLDLDAGIETPGSQALAPIIRTVSPSDFQRQNPEEVLSPVSSEEDYIYDAELFDGDAYDIGIAVPLTLREFSTSQCETESRPRPGRTQSLSLLPPTSTSTPKIQSHVRGRNPVLHRPSSLRRLRADTYPVRRPHSWRRPSDDVWTIPEETSSASNSSKESLDSKNELAFQPQSSPNLTLTVPTTPFNPAFTFQEDYKDSLTPPLRLGATLEGEDPSQISVWERRPSNASSSSSFSSSSSEPKLYSALGSPLSSPTTEQRRREEDERSLALARVTVLEEAPFPPEPVLRLPLRRRKTVRFDLPELE